MFARLDARDAAVRLHNVNHGPLNERHALSFARYLAQVLHKPSVVEPAALRGLLVGARPRIRNVDAVPVIYHLVAVDRRGVDALERLRHPEFFESLHAAGLQQFANNAVRLPQVALKDKHRLAVVGQRLGERGANDTGTDNHEIVQNVCRHDGCLDQGERGLFIVHTRCGTEIVLWYGKSLNAGCEQDDTCVEHRLALIHRS